MIHNNLETDRRNLAQYGYRDASNALKIPASTLRAWTRGQEGFEPVFRPAGKGGLSYFNLIEAQVLRAIRMLGKIKMSCVREALDAAQQKHGVERLLIHKDFRFGGIGLFIERYSKLISLTRSGQIAIRDVLIEHLERVEYDDDGFPRLFYPNLIVHAEKKYIQINPFVSFGRATVKTRPVSTQAIVSRIDAGENVEFVAQDYEIEEKEVEAAIYYEAGRSYPIYG